MAEEPESSSVAVPADLPPVLNLREAAALMRMHANTVRALVTQGKLPACKVGRGWRFVTSDLLDVIRSGYRREAGFGESISGLRGGKGAFAFRSAAAEAAERELDFLLARSRR